MESGTPGVKSTPDGWLARGLAGMPAHEPASPFRAVALGPALPRILRGEVGAVAMSSVADFDVKDGAAMMAGGPAARKGFESLYEQGVRDLLYGTGRETFEAVKMLKAAAPQRIAPANGAVYPRGRFGESLRQIAQLIKADVGLEIAFADVGGWDTHAGQGNERGQLALRLKEFGEGLAALDRDLGDRMSDVVVLTMSEFGRTVRENGNRGTDHGHGTAMLALGGPVKGGRVYGRWPGLAARAAPRRPRPGGDHRLPEPLHRGGRAPPRRAGRAALPRLHRLDRRVARGARVGWRRRLPTFPYSLGSPSAAPRPHIQSARLRLRLALHSAMRRAAKRPAAAPRRNPGRCTSVTGNAGHRRPLPPDPAPIQLRQGERGGQAHPQSPRDVGEQEGHARHVDGGRGLDALTRQVVLQQPPALAARAESQQRFAGEPVGQRHASPRPAGTDPDEGLVEEPLGLEPARDLLAGDHRAVHLAEAHEADALARVGGGDLEAERHPLFQELAQHRHQQRLAEVVADRDAQGRGRAAR